MHAKSLVPILAEIYGVPQETAFMIDRSLSESNLRQKGRGKSFPEMTRREGIIFLIACMSVQKATKAGTEVQQWVNATGYINDFDAENLTETDDAAGEALGDTKAKPPFVRNFYIQQAFEHLGNYHQFNLVDFLLSFCSVLKSFRLSGEDFKFEISLSHGWAAVSVSGTSSGGYSSVRFQTESGSDDPVAYEYQINRTAIVFGDAFLALTIRTADPLAAAD